MIEQPKVITLRRPGAGLSKDIFKHWDFLESINYTSDYLDAYVCPLCGWYSWHALYDCHHCRGKLERLGILKTYYEEWKQGRMNSGF